MAERLTVTRTYKLFIGGQFPRTESGRSFPVHNRRDKVIAHACRASRKDLRNAVVAARAGQPGWADAPAYLRGQILYRMAEMMEGKSEEFASLLAATVPGGMRRARKEVTAAIDRLVTFAGWADKFAQVLGCNNPVAGPFYNFTIPEAVGVVGVIAPEEEPLLGLISLLAPPLCAGNAVIALGSEAHPLATSVLGEVCATSDVPAGVVNLLTGYREELVPQFASHRNIDAVHAAGLSRSEMVTLREGVAENLKRVTLRKPAADDWYSDDCEGPWWIEPFVEMKTVWHPVGA